MFKVIESVLTNTIYLKKVLRALIHNQIKLIDPELKDRDPIKFRQSVILYYTCNWYDYYFRKSDELVVPVQNRIQSFNNAIQRVYVIISFY